MEMQTEYDALIQTMDAVRLIAREDEELDVDGNTIHGELFPNISMGDAPPDTTNQAGEKQ